MATASRQDRSNATAPASAQQAPRGASRIEITDAGRAALAEADDLLKDIQEARTKLTQAVALLKDYYETRDAMDEAGDAACCPTCAQSMDGDVKARLRVVMSDNIDSIESDRRYLRSRLVQLGEELSTEDDAVLALDDSPNAEALEEPEDEFSTVPAFLLGQDEIDDDDDLPF